MVAPAVALLPSAARGLVFGPDDRTAVSTAPGSLYAPIGVVLGGEDGGYATAFLVDDCRAMTVQHVFGLTRSALGRRIVFAANVTGPPSGWRMSHATVVAEGGAQRYAGDARWAADWTLLRLDRCLGRRFGHVRLSSNVPSPTETVATAGYPYDKPMTGGLELDPACRMRDRRVGVLLHDCSSLPGSSGSPIFRVLRVGHQETLEVFAIAVAGHSYSGYHADLMLPVREYVVNYANVAAPVCHTGEAPCHS